MLARIYRLLPRRQQLPVLEQLDRQLLRQVQKRRIPSLAQLKFLPRLLSKLEKRNTLIALLIFAFAIAMLGTRLWWSATVPVPAAGGTYTEGLVGSPRFINPLLAPSNDVDRDISSLVFSGLLRTDENGAVIPDLATGYTVSADGKTYTVELQNNALWQDGQPLTIDDVLYTFQSIQDPAYKSPLRVSFSGVDIKKISDTTLSFALREPCKKSITLLWARLLSE